jgi:hypothetical protein
VVVYVVQQKMKNEIDTNIFGQIKDLFVSFKSDIDARFDSFDAKLNEVKNVVAEVKKDMNEMKTEMNMKFDALEKRAKECDDLLLMEANDLGFFLFLYISNS